MSSLLFAQGCEKDWDDFLAAHAPLVLQVVHLFERDPDRIEDCFVFVCERLRRDDMRRIRRFRADGAASFPTWLRAVVRNLCLDWRRARFGRFRLPRSIARLPPLDQEVFRCVQLRGLSENEALHAVRARFPGLTRAELDDSLARIAHQLDSRQTWSLLTRHPRLESLSGGAGDGDDPPGAIDPADPRAGPELLTQDLESRAALTSALAGLAPRDRLLLRLRFEQELGLDQIARLTARGGAAEAERDLRRALATLRTELCRRGFEGVSVEGS